MTTPEFGFGRVLFSTPLIGITGFRKMLKANARVFLDACTALMVMERAIKTFDGDEAELKKVCEDDVADVLSVELSDLLPELDTLGCAYSRKAAGRLSRALKDVPRTITYERVAEGLAEVRSRFSDELEDRSLYVLSEEQVTFYEPTTPLFGPEVLAKYPLATAEIEEAGKCFALARYTACVFHLMRVMEVAIRAIARCLGVPDPLNPAGKNWGAILKSIRGAMDAKWPHAGVRSSDHYKVFETLYVSIDAVKNPWRNATMHVEHTYTQEQAANIFRAVRSFMEILALRCDEQGDPKA